MQNKILIKWARTAYGATVRWNRSCKEDVDHGEAGSQEPQPEDDRLGYTSRMLACTRCGAMQETSWMQLRTKEGYRAVHCRSCKKQERSSRNQCQCGRIWHHCHIHRRDPHVHRSRKADKNKDKDEKKEAAEKKNIHVPEGRKRKNPEQAPEIPDQNEHAQKKKAEEECRKSANPFACMPSSSQVPLHLQTKCREE